MVENELINIALVGCGEHSHAHAAAAKEIPGVKIVTCCDIVAERAGKYRHHPAIRKHIG